MSYTLGQAAKATGKSKSTISKAIKSGRISATLKDNKSYAIEPVELHRVFPAVSRNSSGGVENERLETPSNTALLLQENAHLKALVDDLKQDREHWRSQAQKVTALIEDRTGKNKGWWSKLVGVSSGD